MNSHSLLGRLLLPTSCSSLEQVPLYIGLEEVLSSQDWVDLFITRLRGVVVHLWCPVELILRVIRLLIGGKTILYLVQHDLSNLLPQTQLVFMDGSRHIL